MDLIDTNYINRKYINFLQLDTMTGKIEIVQWSFVDDDQRKVLQPLITKTYLLVQAVEHLNYIQQKIYINFFLLDKVTGRRWHVQWGFESSKRWIKRIY